MARSESPTPTHETTTLFSPEDLNGTNPPSLSSTTQTFGSLQSSDPPSDLQEVIEALNGVRSTKMLNQRAAFRQDFGGPSSITLQAPDVPPSPSFTSAIAITTTPTNIDSSSSSSSTNGALATTVNPTAAIIHTSTIQTRATSSSSVPLMSSIDQQRRSSSTSTTASAFDPLDFPPNYSQGIIRLSLPALRSQRYEMSETREMEMQVMRYVGRARRGRHQNQDAEMPSSSAKG